MRLFPARAIVVLGLLLAGACSSPTAPTPPVTGPPPVTPPVGDPRPGLAISCPAGVAAVSTTGAAVPVTFAAASAAGGTAPVQVSCTRESGSAFAVGTTEVLCTATDAAAQTAACTFSVAVTSAIPRLLRTKFLAFGDSFTAGEITFSASARLSDGLPNFHMVVVPSASYPTQLASLLRARYTVQAATIDVTNGGWPGEWAEDGAKRLPGFPW